MIHTSQVAPRYVVTCAFCRGPIGEDDRGWTLRVLCAGCQAPVLAWIAALYPPPI